jgi:uncharacterized DUF497 family protein
VRITFDPAKRNWTLAHRGIDFAVDAEKVFSGTTVTVIDSRFDYGEIRKISAGFLDGCGRMDRARNKPPRDLNEVLS